MNESNLAAPFLSSARATPHAVALAIGDQTMSYGELARFSGRIASWLLRSSSDGHVGIFAQRSVNAYAGVLGACIAGRPWVPLGVDLPVERQLEMVERGDVRLIVADREVDPRFIDAGVLAVLGPENLAELDTLPLADPRPVSKSSIAYSMFTSGTTGKPKAVRVPVGALQHFLSCMNERFPIFPNDRVSQFYELYFDLSNFDIFHTLGSGAALHVVPEKERMAPGAFIKEQKITVWSSVPSVLAFMARTRQLTTAVFPHLRAAMFCGEPLPVSSVEALLTAAPSCKVDNQYGPTEATVSCAGEWVLGKAMRVTPSRGIVSIGKAFPGTRMAVVDAEGRFLPHGEKGELALAGAQLALGYDNEELTARRFPTLSHPVHGSERWYLTGDLALEDEQGYFHHLGRLDHQVKVLGHRVELEEIETHLREASGTQAVAVPWPISDGVAQGLVAFLVEGKWTAAAVREAMAARVPAYMVPKRLVALPSLPAAPNGKLDRKALTRLLEQEKAGAAS